MFQLASKRYAAAVLLLGFAFACVGNPIVRAESGVAVLSPGNLPETYPREIQVRQAASKKMNGAYVLDVRELPEFVQGHIPGAVMIPLSQLRDRLDELPKDREIVVVCLSGGRSRFALDIIRKAGYGKSSSMAGGMNAWKAAGYPTATGK
jgi:rhodanese-related sulfurtransferase